MSTLDKILTQLITQNLRHELKDFLELEIIPLVGRYARGDPLETMTVKEVSKLLKVSIPTVRRLIESQELKALKIGNGTRAPLRIRRIDLELFLNKN